MCSMLTEVVRSWEARFLYLSDGRSAWSKANDCQYATAVRKCECMQGKQHAI